MKKVGLTLLVLAAGLSGLALVASATGTSTPGARSIRPHGTVEALALDGSRAAFANGPAVVVWTLHTGKTTNVSGKGGTGASGTYTGGLLDQLAIAGSRVAYLVRSGGNEEADDYLYTSSLGRPTQRQVAQEVRSGGQCGAGRGGYQPACAGTWLGGVVGSGNRILVNRWTTDTTGAITNAGLYGLNGTRFGRPIVTGQAAVEAVAADSNRVAVLQWRWFPPGKTIHVYSSSGRALFSVTPIGKPEEVALSGRNLVVLEPKGKLALYDAGSGSVRKTFTLHGNPTQLQALAVHGNIAVYSTPVRYVRQDVPSESAIRALNLSSGKDRPLGHRPGQITLARIDSTGLVYTNSGNGFGPSRLVFLPFRQVAAAVS